MAGRAVLSVALLAAWCGSAHAADEVGLLKDLTDVLSLRGLPCGRVIRVIRQSENDHQVTCADRHRYRIYLTAAGKLTVQKTGPPESK